MTRTREQIDDEKAHKPRPDLLPAHALLCAGRAMGYGYRKHGDCTWKHEGTEQADPRTHIASAMRHLLEHLHDPAACEEGSGLPVLWHAAAQLLIAVECTEQATLAQCPGTDAPGGCDGDTPLSPGAVLCAACNGAEIDAGRDEALERHRWEREVARFIAETDAEFRARGRSASARTTQVRVESTLDRRTLRQDGIPRAWPRAWRWADTSPLPLPEGWRWIYDESLDHTYRWACCSPGFVHVRWAETPAKCAEYAWKQVHT